MPKEKKDYIKIITGIILSIIGIILILSKELAGIIFGVIILIIGLIIYFNKFENKIEEVKKWKI